MQRGFAYDMIYFTTDLQWFITQQFMLILSYEIAESRLRNIMLQNLNGDTSQLGKNMSRLMIKVSAVHATDR